MSKKQYVVKDLDKFTRESRILVYNNFGKWNKEAVDFFDSSVTMDSDRERDCDSILTQQESLLIVKEKLKKQQHKETKKIRYVLTNESFVEILNDLNARMISNSFTNGVRDGVLESAFDEELNEFVFWESDNKNEDN